MNDAMEKEVIKARLEELYRVSDTKNWEKVKSFFHPDCTYFTFDGKQINRDQFIKFLSSKYVDTSSYKATMSDMRIEVSGDIAWAKYAKKSEWVDGGKPLATHWLMTLIFTKVGSDWKVIHEHQAMISEGAH